MRHFIIDLPIFLDRGRGLHDYFRPRRLGPLLWEVASVRLAAGHKTGFDRGPACQSGWVFLPAVLIELAESVLDIYRADTLVRGVTKGRGER